MAKYAIRARARDSYFGFYLAILRLAAEVAGKSKAI
jgi:hypothetical protein